MAYDTLEITEVHVRIAPSLVDAVITLAHDAGEEAEDLGDVLSGIFGNHDIEDDGTVTALDIEWYAGASFDDDYAMSILAAGARAGDYVTFWDTRDESKDVYRVVFSGDGRYAKVPIVMDGVPVPSLSDAAPR